VPAQRERRGQPSARHVSSPVERRSRATFGGGGPRRRSGSEGAAEGATTRQLHDYLRHPPPPRKLGYSPQRSQARWRERQRVYFSSPVRRRQADDVWGRWPATKERVGGGSRGRDNTPRPSACTQHPRLRHPPPPRKLGYSPQRSQARWGETGQRSSLTRRSARSKSMSSSDSASSVSLARTSACASARRFASAYGRVWNITSE